MDKEIRDLCNEFWDYQMKESPELATYIGYNKSDDKLDSFSVEAYAKRKKHCQDILLRKIATIIEHVDYRKTSFDNKLNVKLLKFYLETFIEGLHFETYLMPYDMWTGPAVSFVKHIIPSTALSTEVDYRKYLARCRAIEIQTSEQTTLLKIGIEKGMVRHKNGIGNLVMDLEKVAKLSPQETPYYEPFKNLPDAISEETRLTLCQEASELIEQHILKPLRESIQFLREEYIPALRPEMSMYTLPNGEQMYQAMLKFHCDTDLTPHQIHAIGLKQVTLLKERIQRVMDKVSFHGTLREFATQLAADSSRRFQSVSEMQNYMYDVLEKKIRPKISQIFYSPPKYELRIGAFNMCSPPTMAEYFAPTEDKPAMLFIGEICARDLPKYEVMCLLLHETEPGHHFQSSYMVSQKDLPTFRKYKDDRRYQEVLGRFPLNTAYTEGWGLYCEELGVELGLYENPYDEFGYLCMRLARAMRLVVDTAVHALKWSREEIDSYMAENVTMSGERRTRELRRYVAMPGQACAYTLGYLKIVELKKKAMDKLGAAFDIKKFHEVCLKCGQVPLQFLEEIVDNFIAEQLSVSA